MQPLRARPSEPAAEAEEALWDAFRAEGSEVARGRLFTLYLPFARSIAGRHLRGGEAGDIEFADLFQLACTGLLEALDRFDPGFGVPFKGYAARRISGSVLSGIAKASEVREQISFRSRVRSERIRSLASGEAHEASEGGALDALIDVAVGLALGFMLEGTGMYVGDEDGDAASAPGPGVQSAYQSLVWKEATKRVLSEVDRLPERDRSILRHHYVDGIAFDQIAILLGLTKGRIAQVHRGALGLLRTRLRRQGDFRLER
ncbi:sigma-70 family RNA polymerase sigma factor [Allosphingosinicella sp.]|jgi:RNA polymerase sigma factor for flagellar operon FliA|uniref:sigma-70 family RNA polymerase sigma factor n=1 Tax=Allosphingosinicella sp. TaxID=2823234 RepID=UPI002F245930